MDIERLKELKEIVYYNTWLSDKSTEDLTMMLDEAIARQSATSEEVAEAIEWMREELVCAEHDQHDHKAFCIDLAITALQAFPKRTRPR